MLVLFAVAAIVTLLGLYEGIIADANPSTSTFHYVQDTSPMGFGTPQRNADNHWSRICSSLGKVPCPNNYNKRGRGRKRNRTLYKLHGRMVQLASAHKRCGDISEWYHALRRLGLERI
jgi:hypothetical protein